MKTVILKFNVLILGLILSLMAVAQVNSQQTKFVKKEGALNKLKSQTKMGGSNGGGGSIVRTRPEIVRELVAHRERLVGYEPAWSPFNQKLNPNSLYSLENPKVIEMFRKILPFALSNAKKIKLKPEDACFHDGVESDASARNNGDLFEICISVSRLSRFYRSALDEELKALILHELAHLVGYNETDAMFIQEFYIRHHDDSERVYSFIYWTGESWVGVSVDVFQNETRVVREIGKKNGGVISSTLTYRPEDRDTPVAEGFYSKNGGWITFPTIDSNMTIVHQRIEFGKREGSGHKINDNSYLLMDGKKISLKEFPMQVISGPNFGTEEY